MRRLPRKETKVDLLAFSSCLRTLGDLVESKDDPLDQKGSPFLTRDNFAICIPNCEMKYIIIAY